MSPLEERGSTKSQDSTLSGISTRSAVTYAAQSQLPRLPIPALDETLGKFPSVVQALLTEEQQEETKQICKEFLEKDGPALQQALLDYEQEGIDSARFGSYVEEFWNESYLAPDSSVVLNLNPFFVLEEGPDPKIAKDQLRRAASLVFASVKLASLVKNECLTPDIFHGNPLCMDQFKALFGSSRQPSTGSADKIGVYQDSSHALWPDTGTVAVDETDILDILCAVQSHAATAEPVEASRNALGALTSLPRSAWAQARAEICELEANKAALRVIDSALFILVLDDFEAATAHEAASNMLHGSNDLGETGDGTVWQRGTCLNRWYDKLQLIVCRDGTAGVNFEHSAIDGHTALRFASDIFAETVIAFAESITKIIYGKGRIPKVIEAEVERAAGMLAPNGTALLDVLPKKLVFELSDAALERIQFAESNLSDQIIANDSYVLDYRDYGKSLIVGNKLSPDSVVQMSMLLAYYKLYGKVVCTYEPVLTKSYFHGRTEAMRTAAPQAAELCRLWTNKSATAAEKLEALRVATKEHSRRVKECAHGKGVDRHLFALKCIAQKKGLPVPAFFESDAWKALNYTILSTSNCGNPALRLFGFGPVVNDGFGVGYIIKDHGVSYSITSKHRQTSRYARTLRIVLDEIKALLTPLSDVRVQQRPTLREAKKVTIMAATNGFDDIYGESDLEKVPPKRKKRSGMGRLFSSIVDRGASVDLLDNEDIRIDVDLDALHKGFC